MSTFYVVCLMWRESLLARLSSFLRLFLRAKVGSGMEIPIMCPRGDVCDRCGAPAVVEIHWREWATKLCQICGPLMLRSVEHEPVQIFAIWNQAVDQTRGVV